LVDRRSRSRNGSFAQTFALSRSAAKAARHPPCVQGPREETIAMNQIVYIVGAVVIVMAILAFLGLR
jgi:hypothetical protein